jgi:PmbA protein
MFSIGFSHAKRSGAKSTMTDKEITFQTDIIPLAERLLAYAMQEGQAYGITDAKISVALKESKKAEIEHGQISQVVSGTQQGVVVLLFAGDRTYSFSKNTLDEPRLQAAILESMELMAVVPENADNRLLEPEKIYTGPSIDFDTRDPNPPALSQMIDYARQMEVAALAQPGVKATQAAAISFSDVQGYTVATNGLRYNESGTGFSAYIGVVAEDANGMQVHYEGSSAPHFSDMADPQKVGEDAAHGAVAQLGAVLPATGHDVSIILSPDAAEEFFSTVYTAIDGGNVFTSETFLKDSLGQQVMSAEVTLIDDPRINRTSKSSYMDSSGVETQPITFIEHGILKAFNASLVESRRLGVAPIGRNDGPTNIFVLPGTLSPAALMQDIKDGVYIKEFHGGKEDVNDGTYSRQANGVRIIEGKITEIAVDGFIVAGNLREMFMNVVLANDPSPLPSTSHSMSVPTTRINGMTIAGG